MMHVISKATIWRWLCRNAGGWLTNFLYQIPTENVSDRSNFLKIIGRKKISKFRGKLTVEVEIIISDNYPMNCKLLLPICSRQIFIKIVIESLWSLEPASRPWRSHQGRLYAVPRRRSYERGNGGNKISKADAEKMKFPLIDTLPLMQITWMWMGVALLGLSSIANARVRTKMWSFAEFVTCHGGASPGLGSKEQRSSASDNPLGLA